MSIGSSWVSTSWVETSWVANSWGDGSPPAPSTTGYDTPHFMTFVAGRNR